MAITATSRLYQDNLRKMRRYLQGRGVNLRQTIVDGVVYADERITVPGMHADDVVIGVMNLSDLNDATGYLDDGQAKASLKLYSGVSNKEITVTALRKGTEGNKIYVKVAAAPGNSLPLSVTIGAYDTVLATTGHPGKTAILVNLATNVSGVALTDGTNSAKKVAEAIVNAQSFPIGDAIVDAVASNGSGSVDATATGPTALTGGTDFNQGPTFASLRTALSPYTKADIKYVARKRGVAGNSITVAYTAGGSLAVGVISSAITVTYVVGVTTAADVIAKVNATKAAAALVLAEPAYGPVSSGDDVSGVIETMVATALTGGQDGGIQLSVASASKKLMVTWVTHDEIDEN